MRTLNVASILKALTILIPAAFFGACGGGGGGGVSPPPVDLPPVADTDLDWDQGNWDEENWQ